MSYTLSSFLKWLTEVMGCNVYPRKNLNVLVIQKGLLKANVWLSGKDRISYEEVFIICTKLQVGSLPGDKDLVRD